MVVVEVGTLVLVRAGMNGTQVALLLRPDKDGWRVRKFKATTHSWTNPTVVEADAIVGHPKPEDPRRGIATRTLTKEQLAEVAWTGRSATQLQQEESES